MRYSTAFLAATTAITIFPTYALQLAFNFPFVHRSNEHLLFDRAQDVTGASIPNRIAIIGAGAAGSSAAFWVAKAKDRFGLDVDVDVFDKNAYIGGRSTTVFPYGDDTLEPIELGASIFAQVNKNLWRATEEFGLQLTDWENDEDDGTTGIWDGKEFVLTVGGKGLFGSWWDTIKILWRYGYNAPTKTNTLVEEMVDKFLTFYQPSVPQWANISSLTSQLSWSTLAAQTTADYFDLQGVDKRYTREMTESATRVNYGQNVDNIQALEALCSLATDGAASVKGGNFQIFEHFIAASEASLHLNTTVTSVKRPSTGGAWQVFTTASDTPQLYRTVILAAPYHQTNIEFSAKNLESIPQQPYVHLHVTLLSTSSSTPNASYFHLSRGMKVPTSVLTTYDGVRNHGPPEPEFNSLTYHGPVVNKSGEKKLNAQGEEEFVVKIFSAERVEDKWLDEMFEGKVGWVLRKEWDAYPVLPPITEFPPVKLADGLYYVNAFEPLISTMETETIAARNVIDLLLREQYDASICKANNETMDAKESDDFVYGWDC